MASAAVIKRVKDFAKQVSDCGVDLQRVVLFGSYAKNKQTKYSDMDVALVANEFSGVSSEDVKLFIKALREHYTIQTLTYNTKDFSPLKDPFVKEILSSGIEIKL